MTDKRINQIRMSIAGFVLLVSSIIYLALPVVAIRWSRIPFPGFLMDPNLVVSDTGEASWPARQVTPPVRYPERLVAVNGEPVTTQQDWEAILTDSSVGDELSFTFEQPPPESGIVARYPEQPTRTVTLPLIPWNATDLWNQFWLFYLTGLVILIISIWAFWVRRQAEAVQTFVLFAALGAITAGGVFDQVTTHFFVRFWVIGLSFFGTFNVMLAAIFPHEIRIFGQRPRLKWVVLLPGLFIGIWAQLWLYSTSDPWAYAIPWRAAYMLNGVLLLISLGLMAYRGFRSPSPLVRQQGRIILVGAVVAFTPLIAFFIKLSVAPPATWLAIAIPPTVIYPLAIGYTIIRYRLLDTDIVLRRGLTYTLLVGALILVVVGLMTTLEPIIAIDSPITLAILIAIIAVVFDPLRDRVQKGVDQYIFQKPVALDQLLRDYNRELTTAVDVDQVATTLFKYIHTAVPDTTPQLFLPDNTLNGYCSYNNSNDVMLDVASPIVTYIQNESGAIDLTEERAWPPIFRQHHDIVLALDAAVIVPMNSRRELLGWLTFSTKQNNQRFRNTELAFFSALADQSLIGLERANVVRRLEAQVAELNLLSQFSQYLNFTIDFDDLLELAYTNYRRLLGIDDFFISWRDPATKKIYTIFYVEAGERIFEKEGPSQLVNDPRIHQVMQTGQMLMAEDEDGRFWIIVPLNAGADTLGTLHTFIPEANRHLPERQEQLFSVFADRTAVALDRLQTRQQLEKRAQQLEIINQVTLSLASTLELDPLLNLVLDKAIELLDTEAGTFMLTIEDTGELEFRVVRGPTSQHLLGNRLPIGTGLAGTTAQTGRPVLVNRVQDDKRWFDKVDADTEFQTQSILTVPLLRQSAVLGVVQLINKRNGAPFNEDDQMLLMAFAGQAVVALENARLLEQTDKALQDRVNELFLLQQLDRDLNTTLDLDNVLNLTLDWILRICNATAGAIVLTDETGEPHTRATRGYDNRLDFKGSKKGLIGQVLSSGQPHVTGNVHEEPNYIEASYSTHSQMTLPIIHQQELIGVIAIESDQFDAFGPEAQETAVRVTNHAAVAITNAILYEQVQEANKAKSDFVSMVSHELKTPMTSMRGYTDLLLSGMTGELSQQQKNFLETIAANINRMSKQIQDLTDISRIETQRLHMEMAPTAFTNIVSETLHSVRGPCDSKNIELHLDLDADLPLIMADKERLVQVLTNLLSNACKYSPPDTNVHVTLKPEMMVIEEDQPPKPMIVCSVKDNGYGISEEDQKRLFTKFFRADDPNIRKAPGTGLGLSITKGIVELHGGQIWVESKPSEGTTFHFSIPQITEGVQ